ncbi:MAG: 1-acyl-sn-glycerol-3-phosphate acyltransferase, partial [Candidatus Binatia bacterium]
VVICPPGSILKTSSGKIRRGATRDAYLRGDLGRRRSARAQWARLAAEDLGMRLARLARRAGGLLFAAYVAIMLALALPPLWALVRLVPSPRAVDRILRRWCRAILALGGCRLRVEGLENLLGTEPAVLVANHASYVDPVVLLAALPKDFRFVAKRELLATPLIGAVIRRVGDLTVERVDLSRSVADADLATEALRGGTSLLFFAEGTFFRPAGLLPFRLGAFKTAVETGRVVVPITIRGTRDVLPADSWLPRPGTISVVIGAPLRPAGSGWPEMVRLRDQARTAIAAGCGEPALERRPAVASAPSR